VISISIWPVLRGNFWARLAGDALGF